MLTLAKVIDQTQIFFERHWGSSSGISLFRWDNEWDCEGSAPHHDKPRVYALINYSVAILVAGAGVCTNQRLFPLRREAVSCADCCIDTFHCGYWFNCKAVCAYAALLVKEQSQPSLSNGVIEFALCKLRRTLQIINN